MMELNLLPTAASLFADLTMTFAAGIDLLASTAEISDAVNRWVRRSTSASESRIWIVIFLAILALWMGLYFWDRARKPRRNKNLGRA